MLELFKFTTKNPHGYLVGLFIICFGFIHRRIVNPFLRKWVSTAFGIFVFWWFGEDQFNQCFLFYFLLGISIKIIGPKYCHLTTIFLAIGYTAVFNFIYYEESKVKYGEVKLTQMMINAKLIGMAFDMHKSYKARKEKKDECYETNPDWIDIFHFTFAYIGIMSGLFYRYRTFDDFINKPYSRKTIPFAKIVSGFSFTVFTNVTFFFLQKQIFPEDYILTEEFSNKPLWYIFSYYIMLGNLFTFFMFGYFTYAESACMAAGFGAYPTKCKSKSGHGPTEHYEEFRDSTVVELEKSEDVDFETVRNVNLRVLFTTSWTSIYGKHWNMTYQYWFMNMVYENIAEDKIVAMIATMLFSALWHGIAIGYFCTGIMSAMAVMTSYTYYRTYRLLNETTKPLYLMLMWFIKMYMVQYVPVLFVLFDFRDIVRYLFATRFVGFFIHLVIHIIGILLLRTVKYFTAKVPASKMN